MVEPDFELIYKTTLFQNIFCCTSTYPKTSRDASKFKEKFQ